MKQIVNASIYDRHLDRWGRIVEVEMPYVAVKFEDGPILHTRFPLRIIGGHASRYWWSPVQSESDAIGKKLLESAYDC